uniref:Uncharacterized protein n=1 Tax=viral metagenome TaxID=1070528 RepID=A0A6M3X4M2_9ZZZZ
MDDWLGFWNEQMTFGRTMVLIMACGIVKDTVARPFVRWLSHLMGWEEG